MSFTPQNPVHVYYHGVSPKVLMGRLLLKNRQIFFEYDSAFIQTGLELSSFKLPLKAGVSALQTKNIGKELSRLSKSL